MYKEEAINNPYPIFLDINTKRCVVVGYKTYVKLIEQFLSQKEVIAGGMRGEVERMKRAVNLAEEDKQLKLNIALSYL